MCCKVRGFCLGALLYAVSAASGCEAAQTKPPVTPVSKPGDIRQPAVSGAFYKGNAAELKADVSAHLAKAVSAGVPAEKVSGILVPHAGYDYSGGLAAACFKAVTGSKYDVIVLLGAPHRYPVPFASVGAYDAYNTPLGNVSVDKPSAEALKKAGVPFIKQAHAAEHSLEVQLPFVQTLFPGTPILPVLVGSDDISDHRRLASIIHEIVRDKKVLVVISTDLSHFPDYETAKVSDKAVLDSVLTLDPDKIDQTISQCERAYSERGVDTAACGRNAVLTGVALLGMMGTVEAKLIEYRNSGDAPKIGDKTRVVGYGAVVFLRKEAQVKKETKESGLSDDARKELLAIARRSVEAAVKRQPLPQVKSANPELQAKCGAFVTIKNNGALRGCIGHFTSDDPLFLLVNELGRSSAVEDPRFVYDRVTPDEMKEIDLEISVLSPLKRTNDPLSIRLGIDGIYIINGWHHGVYLPQVATETGWSKEEFLSSCAQDKAGLKPDAWKDPATEVYTFTAEVFGEKEEGQHR